MKGNRFALCIFAIALLSLVCGTAWPQLDMTLDPSGAERDAQVYFGPGPSPYLTLAERIARGDALRPGDFNSVASDIDRRFQTGQFRLLTFAWGVGNIPAMDALLARGADPLAPLRTTDPPPAQNLLYLILVSQEPKAAPAMQALLRHGLKPDYRDPGDGSTLLFSPTSSKNLALATVLLDAGADPWADNGAYGGNSILNAIDSANFDFVDLLASRGVFKDQPASRIKPLVDDLAGPLQRGDPASLAIQAAMRVIVEQSGYSQDDPNVRYVLSGGKDAR
jgi:hypothetical protein